MTKQPRRIPSGSVETFLEARALLALLGPDIEAERHWLEMGREIGAVCRICADVSRGNQLCASHYWTHYKRRDRATRNEATRINRDARTAS